MAGGNGTARFSVTLPEPLDDCIILMQKRHRFSTKNALIKFLLETHPMVENFVRELYSSVQQGKDPAGS